MDVLRAVDSEIAAGFPVAGFLSYEAATGIDSAFVTHRSCGFPLAWFGVYDSPTVEPLLPVPPESISSLSWKSSVNDSGYASLISRIKSYISAGDSYQVNFTIRMHSDCAEDSYALFYRLQQSQQSENSAYIDIGDYAICSASPELFFEISGDLIRMKPMKGTARRGLSFAEDECCISELRESQKNRAENVMIVDMVRNDLGRIAEAGSVRPTRLFEVERYPTLLQMTSTVEAETRAAFSDVMRALFPCSSITGAPKVRTMQIIRELEESPRGIYTGSIGYWLPNREARFNVAIRTAVIDRKTCRAEYGAGGGIVWDSVDSQELDECLVKADILKAAVDDFKVLETILWRRGEGFYLLEEHIRRAANSAVYFGYEFDEDEIRCLLEDAVAGLGDDSYRVRLLQGRSGMACVEAIALDAMDGVRRVGVVFGAAESGNAFLYHKTTKRDVYESAKVLRSECDDVLLVNERGEVTESTIANLVVETGGSKITPPESSGLLAGVFRGELIKSGEITEGVVSVDMLRGAEAVWLINSVRKWMPAEIVWQE
jgi:para-aminobenzoate synthetase/4-amino-4-deoxychorismate lyase